MRVESRARLLLVSRSGDIYELGHLPFATERVNGCVASGRRGLGTAPIALAESDCLAGAAGFEPPHQESSTAIVRREGRSRSCTICPLRKAR
jgi:hypothetical protein